MLQDERGASLWISAHLCRGKRDEKGGQVEWNEFCFLKSFNIVLNSPSASCRAPILSWGNNTNPGVIRLIIFFTPSSLKRQKKSLSLSIAASLTIVMRRREDGITAQTHFPLSTGFIGHLLINKFALKQGLSGREPDE